MESIIVRYRGVEKMLSREQKEVCEPIIASLLDGTADCADYNELLEAVKYGEACVTLNIANPIEFNKLVPFFRSLNKTIYGK